MSFESLNKALSTSEMIKIDEIFEALRQSQFRSSGEMK